MSNLVSAGMRRLWKSKVFYLCLAAAMLLSAINTVSTIRNAIEYADDGYTIDIDESFFSFLPTLPIFISAFTSLFIGTEYSDGTIRNKVIVGHKRKDIYLSSLIVSEAVAMMLLAASYAIDFMGLFYFKGFKIGMGQLLTYLGLSVLLICASTALLVTLVMLCHKKAAGAVAAIMLTLLVIIFSSMIYMALEEPPMVQGYELGADGKIALTEPQPNPGYVSGLQRELYYFIHDFLPVGPMLAMANLEVHAPLASAVYSLLITVASTGLGIVAFGKKDLK